MRSQPEIVDPRRGPSSRCVLLAAAWTLVCCCDLSAAPILAVRSGGAETLSVNPGETIFLDVDLSGLAGELAVSAGFEVRFSAPGLVYESYVWTPPFLSGSGDDLSEPGLASLPAVVVDDLFGSAGSAIDVHFDNFASSGGVGNGALTTLTLQVPQNFSIPSTVVIDVVPGEFVFDDSPFAETPAAGSIFVLNIDGAVPVVGVTLRTVRAPTSPEHGMPPEGITSVCLDSQFQVEVWVSQIDGGAAGIAAGSIDVAYTNAVATADTLDHGSIFQNAATGTIDNATGLINDFGGATAAAGVGVVPEWALLGRVSMSATGAGIAMFTLGHGGIGFSLADGQGPLNGDPQVALGTAQSVIVSVPQLSGDTDCDLDVDLEDFGRFHACLIVSGPSGNAPLPTECAVVDLDGDGNVDLNDFGIFQASFGSAPG